MQTLIWILKKNRASSFSQTEATKIFSKLSGGAFECCSESRVFSRI
jgi:hypothetical protein